MTFHFKQEDADPMKGIAILDVAEYAKLAQCPQCDRVGPSYGHVENVYFVECPRCCLRVQSRVIDPRSIRCLRNAVRFHKRALTSAVLNWNDRAAAKGSPHWPKVQPLSDLPPEVDV